MEAHRSFWFCFLASSVGWLLYCFMHSPLTQYGSYCTPDDSREHQTGLNWSHRYSMMNGYTGTSLSRFCMASRPPATSAVIRRRLRPSATERTKPKAVHSIIMYICICIRNIYDIQINVCKVVSMEMHTLIKIDSMKEQSTNVRFQQCDTEFK